jgi:hypothetical protein
VTASDKPRRIAFELPAKAGTAGNKTSSITLELGPHKFKCKPEIDGITLLEFAALAGKMDTGDDEEAAANISPADSAEAAGAILQLLRVCIIDFDGFSAVIKEHSVDIELLGEMAAKLVEQYTDRPTQSPPGS